MKRNPYRLAEKVGKGLVILLSVVAIGSVIHAMEGWRVAGYVVLAISVFLFVCWFTERWGELRREWDYKHQDNREGVDLD